METGRDTRRPQKICFFRSLYALEELLREKISMYTVTYPDLIHLHFLSETLPTNTRSDWAPGMASRARMTQSALQNTCSVCVLFLSRRILYRLENGSCRLDLVFVGWSKCVRFWSTFSMFAANVAWEFMRVKGCCSSVTWMWNWAEWRESLKSRRVALFLVVLFFNKTRLISIHWKVTSMEI